METGSPQNEACASDAAAPAAASPVFDIVPVAPGAPDAPLVYASPHSGGCYPDRMLEALRLDPSVLRGSEDSLVDGLIAPASAMRDISRSLAEKSIAERAKVACIGNERADLVVAGCAILETIMDLWPAERLGIADRGIREGILRSLMGTPKP